MPKKKQSSSKDTFKEAGRPILSASGLEKLAESMATPINDALINGDKNHTPISSTTSSGGTLPTGAFEHLIDRKIGKVSSFLPASRCINYMHVIEKDNDKGPSYTSSISIPYSRAGQSDALEFSTIDISLTKSRIPRKTTPNGIALDPDLCLDDHILGLLNKSVGSKSKIALPDSLNIIEAVHTVLRDSLNHAAPSFALAVHPSVSDFLVEHEFNSTPTNKVYTVTEDITYAGIPIIPSESMPVDKMFVLDKDSTYFAYVDHDVRSEGSVLSGAAFGPDALVYEVTNDCHTVHYVYSEDTNDICLDCDTCGFSYWAGTELEAVERLTEHTEDKVYFKTRTTLP